MQYYITQKGQSLLEARKRGRRHSDQEEEGKGDRNTVDDEALEGKFAQERLKFLKGKK